MQPLLQADNMGFLWDIFKIEDVCNCPLPCETWTYETTVSYSSVPNPGYAVSFRSLLFISSISFQYEWHNIMFNADEEETSNVTFSSDYIIVDLYFENLVYTKIEESQLITPTVFLSNIGGQMSIWLGKSWRV